MQYQAKERMEKHALHTLQIKAKDFRWVKAEKEILVDGKMFDVHSYTAHQNMVTVRGLFDEEETAINNLLSGQNNNDRWLTHLLYVGGLVCAIPLSINFSIEFLGCHKKQSFPISSTCVTRAKEIITPPPQFVFA